MEEKAFEVIVTMRNVYRIVANNALNAVQIAAEDYIWGEDALIDVDVTLAEEE